MWETLSPDCKSGTKCGQKVAESLLDEHRRTPGKIQENPRTRHRVHQEEEASLGS